mmetsp:Transcript_7778/g.17774  ORF Transcript_7778/g.17774 Transcript_7778/m.17774 type:complete len:228 (+) Transcript_7778:1-684(+)
MQWPPAGHSVRAAAAQIRRSLRRSEPGFRRRGGNKRGWERPRRMPGAAALGDGFPSNTDEGPPTVLKSSGPGRRRGAAAGRWRRTISSPSAAASSPRPRTSGRTCSPCRSCTLLCAGIRKACNRLRRARPSQRLASPRWPRASPRPPHPLRACRWLRRPRRLPAATAPPEPPPPLPALTVRRWASCRSRRRLAVRTSPRRRSSWGRTGCVAPRRSPPETRVARGRRR